MKTLALCNVLGLRPLDRLQINDAREIREMYIGARMGRDPTLPFLYFQRSLEDGRLEVRSPNGYATAVRAEDVCDIAPGEPVTIRAMPREVFIARLRLSPHEARQRPGAECYAEAHVLYVFKDKWGRVDQTFVWFTDPTLNTTPWNAPVHPDDTQRLAAKAKRIFMPVMSPDRGTGGHSAEHGLAHEQDLNRVVASVLIRSALKGDRASVEALAHAGIKKLNQATICRLAWPPRRHE